MADSEILSKKFEEIIKFDERITEDIGWKFWRWSLLGFFIGFVIYIIVSKNFEIFDFLGLTLSICKRARGSNSSVMMKKLKKEKKEVEKKWQELRKLQKKSQE